MTGQNKFRNKESKSIKNYDICKILKSNNLQSFKKCLELEADFNKKYDDGNTILHLAVKLRNYEAIEIIFGLEEQVKQVNFALRNDAGESLFSLFNSNKELKKLLPKTSGENYTYDDRDFPPIPAANNKSEDKASDYNRGCQKLQTPISGESNIKDCYFNSPRYDPTEDEYLVDVAKEIVPDELKAQGDNNDSPEDEQLVVVNQEGAPNELKAQGDNNDSYCIIM